MTEDSAANEGANPSTPTPGVAFYTQLTPVHLARAQPTRRRKSKTPAAAAEQSSNARRLYTNWTHEMEKALFDKLINGVRKGGRSDSGYKPWVWDAVVKAVNNVTHQVVNKKQCNSKHDLYKKDYRVWKEICDQSGWTRDEDGIPCASNEVMDRYFEAHPEASKFRETPIDFEDQLFELFDGVLATGKHAISIDSLLSESNEMTSVENIDPVLHEASVSQMSFSNNDSMEETIELDTIRQSVESDSWSQDSNSLSRASTTTIKDPLRLRKRSHANAQTISKKKKKETGPEKMTRSIQNVVEELQGTRYELKDPVEKATDLFFSSEHFQDLDMEDQLLVVQAFEQGNKANIFLGLRKASESVQRHWINELVRQGRESSS